MFFNLKSISTARDVEVQARECQLAIIGTINSSQLDKFTDVRHHFSDVQNTRAHGS
jgi:hypothetical protein